jgi:hypothetical protein
LINPQLLTSTRVTRPQPTPPIKPVRAEPARGETAIVTRRSPWPYFAVVALAVVVGPVTAWLLLYAPVAGWQRFGVAVGIPVGLGALAVLSTRYDQPTTRPTEPTPVARLDPSGRLSR